MMNRAVSGQFQPGVKENIAYFTHTERRNIATEGQGSRSNSPATSTSQPAEVRGVIEIIQTFITMHCVRNYVKN